jgi:hypothetical protein
MKNLGLSLLLLVGIAYGQEASVPPTAAPEHPAQIATTATTHPVERTQAPTYSDIYCAGFISKQDLPRDTFVTGGLTSPHATKFVSGEVVYLSGSHYKDGDRVTFIRDLRDPNRYETFEGQHKLLQEVGQPYSELGHAKIVDTRHTMAIAQIEFSCEAIVPGDVAVPFIERQKISFRSPQSFDRFAPPNGKTNGRIVMAKDFDGVLATGQKVYLTVGSNQGVKVGDYFRISRTYDSELHNEVDSLSFKASTTEDTQKHPPSVDARRWTRSNGPVIRVPDMPRRSLGELIVLSVNPTSATGMITFSLEDIHVGDGVELIMPTTASASSGSASQNANGTATAQ